MDLAATLGAWFVWRPAVLAPGGPPIRTSLTDAELQALRELGRDGRVVEIGAAYGASTVAIAQTAAFVLSVDPEPQQRPALLAYGVEDRVSVVAERSQDILPSLPAASFDLAFIDGDHSFQATLADLEAMCRLVRLGGWVAIHDYGYLEAVTRAVDQWRGRARVAVVDSLAVVHRWEVEDW